MKHAVLILFVGLFGLGSGASPVSALTGSTTDVSTTTSIASSPGDDDPAAIIMCPINSRCPSPKTGGGFCRTECTIEQEVCGSVPDGGEPILCEVKKCRTICGRPLGF